MTSRILTYATAIILAVPVMRYAVAFQYAEPPLAVWGGNLDISPITGLAFGLAYEAIAFAGIQEGFAARRRGLKAWWWPVAGSAAQTAAGVAIILPVMVAEVRSVPLASLLGAAGCWLWAGVVAVSVVLAFATAALGLAVQPLKRSRRREGAGESGPERALPRFTCGECGKTFGSQNALNAHRRIHNKENDDDKGVS